MIGAAPGAVHGTGSWGAGSTGGATLPGVEAAWHRRVAVRDADGAERSWHLLDGAPSVVGEPRGTVLAVHGNPTWSYLWRASIAAAAEAGWRVVAVDQLDMGWSERTGTRRRLSRRIDDLLRLTDAIGLTGASAGPLPLVSLGHDWGGLVSVGWALAVRGRGQALAGLVLTNTTVDLPVGAPLPAPLRVVTAPGMLRAVTVSTRAFVDGTLATSRLTGHTLAPDVRAAYRQPYARAGERGGVGAFVADIPQDVGHPSRAAMDAVASGLAVLGASGEVPALVMWGTRDPVFGQSHLDDLRRRLPGADVHRFEGAGHLVQEEADVAGVLTRWLTTRLAPAAQPPLAAQPSFVSEPPVAAHPPLVSEPPVIMGSSVSAAPVRTETPMITAQPPAIMGASVSAGPAETRTPMITAEVGGEVGGAVTAGVGAGERDAAEGGGARRSMTDAMAERAAGPSRDEPAVIQLRPGAPLESITWGELTTRVDEIAAGLLEHGARPGERISLLVRPGVDLTALLYACLRIGLVGVVADAGLGVRGLTRAIRGSAPQHLAAVHPALGIAWALRWPGRRIAVGRPPLERLVMTTALRLTGAAHLDDLQARGRAALAAGTQLPGPPAPDADAIVIFTSGSTGPAKGVVYTHARMAAMVGAFGAMAGIGPGSPLVAAFAPFALLGPGLGATTAVPETDVTKPATLTATALADAVAAVGHPDASGTPARVSVFASPAALANVIATAGDLREEHRAALAVVRLLMSAGAPVDPAVLAAAAALVPGASAHTPYGMTEALPATDVSLDELLEAGEGEGVLVGHPIAGARVALAPLDDAGRPAGPGALTTEPWVSGEVSVSSPHVKDRYDQLWDTQRLSATDPGWHRTGDVGHLDDAGRLWVEGRLAHVLVTAGGVVTPVGPEQRVQRLDAVRRAALVGVGPRGTQQGVVVLESAGDDAPGPAPLGLAHAVRTAAAPVPVAAVLVVEQLPTDVRHRSKIDRARVGTWADDVLAGRSSARRAP